MKIALNQIFHNNCKLIICFWNKKNHKQKFCAQLYFEQSGLEQSKRKETKENLLENFNHAICMLLSPCFLLFAEGKMRKWENAQMERKLASPTVF